MRLTDGLHALIVSRRPRNYSTHRWPKKGRREFFYALAWVPGSDGDAMWKAHTEEQVRQRYMEKLTRGAA